jgi:hypothetical protein
MLFDIGKDLPYLKIWHTIPNERINADAILNDDADLNRKKGDLSSAIKALAETKKNINNLQNQLTSY